MPSNNYAIVTENLYKHYRKTRRTPGKEALHDLSLAIPKGSIFGLLGPNGAGKSTLVNILSGLVVKSSGNVSVNGYDLDSNPRQVRSSIGVVPQEVALDPFFPVEATLEYYAGYFGIPKKQRRTKELLEVMNLTDKANVNSRRLSGGMKRRVLIAKALVHSPSILLLDEPTAGVDVELRTQLWDYVKKLNKQGTTILLTTHYLEEAEELCDEIAIINNGRVIAQDSTSKLTKIIDRKQLTLHVREELTDIPDSFKPYEPQLLDSHTLTLNYRPTETTIDVLLRFTNEANLTITDLSTDEPDLEDTFRLLIEQSTNTQGNAT